MRVALVHDWLTGMRGGERVLERLCGLFPEADVFTLVWKRGSVSRAIESHRIRTSFLQHLPDAERRYRWFLPLFPAAIESLDLSGYDAVISTSHAVAKAARAPRTAFHLSYVFTPMRYIWELEEQYFPPGKFPWPLSAFVRETCRRLREWDRATAGRASVHVAISNHVAERIRRHWGREARVLYPPVELSRFTPAVGPRDYDLLAGAMAPYKRGELAIEACARLGRKLIVAGTGPMEAALRRAAGAGREQAGRARAGREQAGRAVEFRGGWIADEEMARLYAGARALHFPGEEDFGIVPLEALASGCPVIAYGVGGALETVGRGASPEALAKVAAGGSAVVPGGVLFGRQTVDSVCEAIGLLDRARLEPGRLAECARPFSSERFDREFRDMFDAELARARLAR